MRRCFCGHPRSTASRSRRGQKRQNSRASANSSSTITTGSFGSQSAPDTPVEQGNKPSASAVRSTSSIASVYFDALEQQSAEGVSPRSPAADSLEVEADATDVGTPKRGSLWVTSRGSYTVLQQRQQLPQPVLPEDLPLQHLARLGTTGRRSRKRLAEQPAVQSGDKVHPDEAEQGAGYSEELAYIQQEQPPLPKACLPLLNQQIEMSSRRFIVKSRPAAGDSMKHGKQPADEDPTSGNHVPTECWQEPPPSTFHVRSAGYLKTRQKEPAAASIYRLVGMDIYAFDFKLHHIARHVRLPPVPELGEQAQALPPDQQVPPLLIMNIQLPMYPPSLFRGPTDGSSQSLVLYFALPDGWNPADVGNPAAVALLQRFAQGAVEPDGSSLRDRLKLIALVTNLDQWAKEAPLSPYEQKLLNNYNGKPVLTRPQQRIYSGPNYLEVDVDVHTWAYLARRTFVGYIPRLASVVLDIAFVLQGNRPDELPEVVLGCARTLQIDLSSTKPFPAGPASNAPKQGIATANDELAVAA